MSLNFLDLLAIVLFFLSMVVVGIMSYFKSKNSEDYFVAGGNLPWWLAGISHHVSGHSGAVFVAYAAVCYTHGFTMYMWWALPVAVVIVSTAHIFPVYWVRLRRAFQIQSPLEYLSIRYNVATQQIIAWAGVILKVFDVGAKWAAIGILLHVVAGISMTTGILISGVVTIIYVTFGGLWGVIITDFIQFLVQVIGGVVMFVLVVNHLGGISSVSTLWDQLPPAHSQLFNDPYSAGFVAVMFFICFLSYNGGIWSLATRYISSPNEKEASKAARLSGILYLFWPLILFFPMWAAPTILPGLENPNESYALLMLKILPQGMIGLVIASLFAATMGMTSSDVNTIAAVITRDILPVVSPKFRNDPNSLRTARITTFIFTLATIIIALNYERFGGVLGLIINWFAALLGPTALPLLFGLLPAFKSSGPKAAIASIAAGLLTFVIGKQVHFDSLALEVGLPTMVSLVVFIGVGLVTRKVPAKVTDLINALKKSS
ncbi:sodium:solute symporter family protein [Segetibacter sp.]|jgi:SSS family solute:Na+ symporter|uniref:sodium:solute symporter family protein n=1 Tax=Segetibacter sp. TaxID=2231182 RepID=UPI002620E015|nr:sodium:solute symporter family protein [Segetibacter sp.]MCW3078607.1 Na+/solute symporter [Segetibacter sp.]